MPFISGVFQVSTQAEMLQQTDANLFSGLIKNIGQKTAYLGDETVSVATGFPFEPGDVIEAEMHAKAPVYAIADTPGTELRWLAVT